MSESGSETQSECEREGESENECEKYPYSLLPSPATMIMMPSGTGGCSVEEAAW